ncbi:MAG: replicase [Brapardiv virus 4]|nr:MAG: replicase [Brapardiv virus 4]
MCRTTMELLPTQCDIAVSAEVVKRRTRGGRRNLAKKPGYCYLSVVPKRMREDMAKDLGPKPQLQIVAEAWNRNHITPRHRKMIISSGGLHMTKSYRFPIRQQLALFLDRYPLAPIGSDCWDVSEEELFVEMYIKTDHEAINARRPYVLPHVDVDEDAPFFEPGEVEIEPVKVKAPGNCWRSLLPMTNTAFQYDLKKKEEWAAKYAESEEDDPLEQITATLLADNIIISPNWLIRYEYQENHDIHMLKVKLNFDKAEMLRNKEEGDIDAEEFVKVLRDANQRKKNVLVGDGTTSSYDKMVQKTTSPDVRGALERAGLNIIRDGLSEIERFCPYKIPEKNQHMMEKLSIPWSAQFTIDHPHPIHAALRRIMISNLAKNIKVPCTILGMKEEHHSFLLREMQRLHGDNYPEIVVINPIVDVKDISRYADTGTVPDSVFSVPKINTPMLFCDDSGHYLSPAWMIAMQNRNPNLRVLSYTSIFDLLSLEFQQSPYPDFLNWRVRGSGATSKIIYILEGDEKNVYTQPFDPTMILLGRVESKDGESIWNGGVVEGRGPVRLHMFYRYHVEPVNFMVQCDDVMMNLPRLFRGQPQTQPIKVKDYVRMYQYSKTLPMDKPQNQWGKIRLMAEKDSIYLPVGDQDWVVKVVLEAARIGTSADLQPKNYDSIGAMVKYKTVGHLYRIWKKHTTLKYAERRRMMINNPDPVRVWPTLNVAVSMDEKDYATYGISWTPISGDVCLDFWRRMLVWLKVQTRKVKDIMIHDPELEVRFDAKGRVLIPFMNNTLYYRSTYGVNLVKESQRRDFLTVFEHKKVMHEITQPVKHVIRAPYEDYLETREENPFRDPSVDIPCEPIQDEVEVIDVDTIKKPEGITFNASGRISEKTRSEGHTEPEDRGDDYKHCELCPSWHEELERGMVFTLRGYSEFCLARHKAMEAESSDQAVKRAELGLLERSCRVKGIQSDGSEVPQNFKQPEEGEALIADKTLVDLRTQLFDQVREKLERRNQGYVHLEPKVIKPDKGKGRMIMSDWQKREAEFNKLYNQRPKVISQVNNAVGETLWDLLFPKTVGHRVAKVPYKRVLEFPPLRYPVQDCILEAVHKLLGKSHAELLFWAARAWPDNGVNGDGLPLDVLHPIALHYGIMIILLEEKRVVKRYGVDDSKNVIELNVEDEHVEPYRTKVRNIIKPIELKRGNAVTNKLAAQLSQWPALEWVDWKPEAKRAADYVRALMAKTTGLLGETVNEDALLEWLNSCDLDNAKTRKFAIIAGDPGCRKSSKPQKLLGNKAYKKEGVFTWSAATTVLAQDVRNKLDAPAKDEKGRGMPGNMVATFERVLAKSLAGDMLITDENKYPKGYHALVNILCDVKYNLFLCDPWQTSWHEPNSDCMLNDTNILGEAEYYLKYLKAFMIGTWRLSMVSANFWRMPLYARKAIPQRGGWAFMDRMPHSHLDIVDHFPELTTDTCLTLWEERHEFYASHVSTIWASALRDVENNTFAGSQGLTVPLVVIEIDERVLRMADARMIYTPMTRSQYIVFVKRWADNNANDMIEDSHPVFSQLAYYRRRYKKGVRPVIEAEHTVSIREVSFPFPDGIKLVMCGPPEKLCNADMVKNWYTDEQINTFIDPDVKTAGTRLARDQEGLEEAYQFWPYIDETPYVEPEEAKLDSFHPAEARIVTHLPAHNRENFIESQNELLIDRFDAELFMKQYSEQLPDTPLRRRDHVEIMSRLLKDLKGKNRLEKRRKIERLPETESPLYYHTPILNWALKQNHDDLATRLAAFAQRFNWSTRADNYQQLKDQEPFGLLCWHAFKSYMGWDSVVPFDDELYERSHFEFQDRRGSRSAAQKKGSLNRAEPEFFNVVRIKNQIKLKIKEDRKEVIKAKPGQPVVTHRDDYLFKFGPWGIYILEQLKRIKPDHWMFYAGIDAPELISWSQTHLGDGMLKEMNDQTGQDQAAQGWAVVFFTCLMRHLQIPEEIIRDFVEDKATKVVHHKTLAIMTDSGEIFTYLINTTSSAARECAMFSLPYGLPMASGGDDTMRVPYGGLSKDYYALRHLDPCTDKRYQSHAGSFVSFMLKGNIMFKDPITLLRRLLVKIATGEGEDSVKGYFLLWSLNYNLGDKLYEVFDEEEMEAHQLLTKIFFNLRREGIKNTVDWDRVRDPVVASVDMNPGNIRNWEELSLDDIVNVGNENPDFAKAGSVDYMSALLSE